MSWKEVMNLLAPIELHFYDDEDNIVATHTRSRIPSYLLDTAINLQTEFSKGKDSTNSDALFDFVVEFYGAKFTRDELKKSSDLLECMSVLKAILTRATHLTRDFAAENPMGPSPTKT